MKHLTALLTFLCLMSTAAHCSSLLTIGPSDDAQVVEGYPGSNYGDKTYMYVASGASGFMDERGWLKFNLNGQLPASAVIESAVLRLYCWKAEGPGNMAVSVHGSTVDNWSEASLTWSNQPAFGSEIGRAEMAAGVTGVWYEWTVTDFVRSQMADQTVSFAVKAVMEGQSPGQSYGFDGKEYSSAVAPQLKITYQGEWPVTNPITIFHVNDMHSRLLPHEMDIPEPNDTPVFERVGGAAYLTAKMLELKSSAAHSLVLDAGDISEGNPVGDLRGNGGMVDFLKLLDSRLKGLGGRGLDASVVGNHDVRALRMLTNMKDSGLPYISVNVCREGTQTPYFTPYVTVTINGTKIGLLGYTNDESSYLGGDTEGVIDVVKCIWQDSNPSTIDLRDWVNELRVNQGCDLVVLLSHIGQSRVCSGEDALVKDTGGVNPPEVVVSGHWHSSTERAWRPAQLNGKTLIVEAASYMQMIGELRISEYGRYLSARKHWIRCDQITPDASVSALMDSLIAEYNASGPAYGLYDVIGYSAEDLTLDKDKWWTGNEFPWSADNKAGGWICDSMQWKAAAMGYPCQLAIQSGGGIRRDVPAGPVTYIQLYETYPWADDNMVRIRITGQEIWNFIEEDYCGTSISKEWLVTAHDGIITGIAYQGAPLNLSGSYDVIISEYMYAHPDQPWSDTTPEYLGYSIRQAAIDYTGQFTAERPMTVPGPRYQLNTEFSGGFTAVVTMMADSESQPYFEAGFIRLLGAAGNTVEKRGTYTPADLVNADGSINPDHRFSEIMHYRSHLGFADGQLKNGDIIEVWGEGGFHRSNPQLVDQEGIWDAATEIKILGHDPTLARPTNHTLISSFWDEAHENHYVRFVAEKTGNTSVRDSAGTALTVYQPGGYYTKSLPGNVGDSLELTGVVTGYDSALRFRCDKAEVTVVYPCPKLDGQNIVDFRDYAILAANWQSQGSGRPGDLNSDGQVNIGDLEIFAGYWLHECQSSQPGTIAAGDLVISEIMNNPNAVTDSNGEWFEVYNASSKTLDLNGLTIRDDGGNSFTVSGSLTAGPGEYLVFCCNANTATNGGVAADYAYSYGSMALGNADDELIILNGTTVIDAVVYDGGPNFPDLTGQSMSLKGTALNAAANDLGSNWAAATVTYGSGDRGTPGAAN